MLSDIFPTISDRGVNVLCLKSVARSALCIQVRLKYRVTYVDGRIKTKSVLSSLKFSTISVYVHLFIYVEQRCQNDSMAEGILTCRSRILIP